MADNKKCSTPSTSKQQGTEVQDVHDVEKLDQNELGKSEMIQLLTNEYKYD